MEGEGVDQGKVTLLFGAPDRWRIIVAADGALLSVAVADESVLMYDSESGAWLLSPRDRIGEDWDYEIVETDFSVRTPTWDDYVAARRADIGCHWDSSEPARLLDRACTMYDVAHDFGTTGDAGLETARSSYRHQVWVDDQLLVPLREIRWFHGELGLRVDALSVRIEAGTPARAFNTTPPEGKRVFKGALSFVPDLETVDLGLGADGRPEPPGTPGDSELLVPQYIPRRLVELSQTYDEDGTWWTIEWAASSGATLVLEQSRDPQSRPLPGLAQSESIQVGAWPGRITELKEPFQRIVLVWEVGPTVLRIDAGEVRRAEVLKMAASVKPVGSVH
jgi:hypothetical protein